MRNERTTQPARAARAAARALYRIAMLGVLLALALAGAGAAQARPSAAKNGYAQIGELRMYYEVHGQGQPLLVLHGGGSTIRTTYGAILPQLAKARKVIAPEQQGHGHTGDLDRPLTFRQMADDTAALLRELDVEQVDVLGFSNGGGVAIELALRHPALVRRLVIGSVYYRKNALGPELLRTFETASAENMPEIYRRAYLDAAPNPEDIGTLVSKLMRNMLTFEGWTDAQLRSIEAPTMILQGTQDVASLEHVAALARIIPDARLVVLPGGHGTYLGESMAAVPGSRLPEYTTGIVLEFLDAAPGE